MSANPRGHAPSVIAAVTDVELASMADLEQRLADVEAELVLAVRLTAVRRRSGDLTLTGTGPAVVERALSRLPQSSRESIAARLRELADVLDPPTERPLEPLGPTGRA